MPIENEVKYVLEPGEGKLEGFLFAKPAIFCCDIEQAYLDKGSRIRSKTWVRSGDVEYYFTYKRDVDGGQIEIETEISKADFDGLWATSEEKLSKRRFTIDDPDNGPGVLWDIDFFKHNGRTHFLMAEAEMQEGQDRPESEPAFITSNLLYYAGRESGYTSRKLTSVEYAEKLLAKLRKAARDTGSVPACDIVAYADDDIFKLAA